MKYVNLILIVLSFLFISNGLAQPDRKAINTGVDKYLQGDYFEAEQNFKKALESAPENFISNFNMGDALYKQEKYDEAINHFQSSLGSADNDLTKAKVHHNIGNALLKSNKIKESIEAYKTALRHNPDDTDTKYNLSYALSLLNNEDQQQNQDENNDQQQNDNEDQKNQDQQQNNDEQKNDQQNRPQPKDQESQQDNTKQPQQQESKISKQDAERILEALKNNEKDLQNELRKKTGKPVKTDKDW